ncbi:MAG: fibronectin type III domain-containing protein [Gammaproteobacteria bacterium]
MEVRVAASRGALRSDATYLYVLERSAAPPSPPGTPEPPSNVRTLPGTQDLGLVWGAPGDGQTYSAYRVRWRTMGMPAVGRTPGQAAGAWQPGTAGGRTRLARYAIGGLTTGTTYEAQVRAVNSLGNAGYWSQPVQATPREFVFDVDASGGDADGTDATYIARYLLGLRGADVTAGFNVSAAQTESIIAVIVTGVRSNKYDVDSSGATTAADGIMIMRYLLGVTGDALTAGQSSAPPADVQAAIDDLQP